MRSMTMLNKHNIAAVETYNKNMFGFACPNFVDYYADMLVLGLHLEGIEFKGTEPDYGRLLC
jgi:hypothetical protein